MALPEVVTSRPAFDLSAVGAPVRRDEIVERSEVPVAANHPFHLRWSRQWSLEPLGKGHVILPLIQRRKWSPGIDGVSTPKEGQDPDAHYRDIIVADTRKGMTYLDPIKEIPSDLLPEGRRGGYLQSAPCRSPLDKVPGRVYFEPFDVVEEPDSPESVARIRCGYPELRRKWRVHLVETGQRPAPTERDRADIVRKLRKELGVFQAKPSADHTLKDAAVSARQALIQAAEKATLPTRKAT
jgi:hypothetical protein